MKTKYLNEVAEIRAGNSAPQGKEPFNNGRFNFYRTFDVGQVKQGEISVSRDKVNKETYTNLKKFQINTILFPKSGASTFNNNRVIIKEEGAIASHLAGIKANPEILNDYYLYYFLLTVDAKDLVQDSAYPSVNLKQISQIEIPVPSLQEQEKIVERLDGVLEVINKSNLVNSKRKIDKFKFIKSYFAYKEENIEFEIKTLPEISINLDSKRKPIKKSLRVKGDVPYYGATGLIDYVEDFIFDEELLLISEDGANLIDRKYPIAFSINGKSWVNNHAHVMKFNDKILQKYIMYYFNFLDISKHVTGAAQPKLNQKRLNKIEIPVPKFEKDLNDIVETFKNINIKISLLNQNLAKSNILFDQLEKSILKKEFSYE